MAPRWLAVSTSGFYEWAARPASATALRRECLSVLVRGVFEHHQGRYGHRRIHAVLAASGQACSVELVRHLMQAMGLQACQPSRRRVATTVQAQECADIPDLVERDFSAAAPGAKLVGDITY
jgi:transposase InsO family protein